MAASPTPQETVNLALLLLQEGKPQDAARLLQTLPVPTPPAVDAGGASAGDDHGARFFLAAGRIHASQRLPDATQQALAFFDRGLRHARSDELLYHRGLATRQAGYQNTQGVHRQLADARRYFDELVERHGGIDAVDPQACPLAGAALQELAYIAERIGPADTAHRLLTRLAALQPQDARVQASLAESAALLHPGEDAPADTPADAPQADAPRGGRERKFSRYPDQAHFDGSPAEILQALAADSDHVAPFLTPDSRFFCIGSCFAREIGIHLRRQGFGVAITEIGETVNNSYTNLLLLEYVATGQCPAQYQAVLDGMLAPAGGAAGLRQTLADADVVVFTLGVAPAFFDDAGAPVLVDGSARNALSMARRHCFRTTDVQENLANLRRILDLLQGLGKPKRIVLTLSPVPLRASFEYRSAVVADCVSKSTLRVVVDMLVRERGGPALLYWPSFEMVRWVSGHRGRVFGVDDDSPAHISFDLVAEIVGAFTRRFLQPPAA